MQQMVELDQKVWMLLDLLVTQESFKNVWFTQCVLVIFIDVICLFLFYYFLLLEIVKSP